ncbi:formyltetrahydrofolate deformylase [Sediminibacillus dalangtanensis]|uniref:Formyltetrahydrofolate deformylase n=1 Tax=Sediminibacillus dalangtanensis TaxID=2729421 RepID=A0ABX7VVP8_9BACI|nr:formyltetrahydrofolate deformylase [Sediminibacillus dalangtanensis]QTN01045.1 formyltetrahydrofolate deformylase [Sediminibacillus dalangtanensis]
MTDALQTKWSTFQEQHKNKARLLIHCPDQPGIVSAVSEFLYQQGANIIESNQYTTDPAGGEFFMRVVFEAEQLPAIQKELEQKFQAIAHSFQMDWRFSYVYQIKRMAIFVSKELHCLRELLWEWQSGDLIADIPLVISNHEDARGIVESLGIPFYHIPANKDIRKQVEAKQLELLKEFDIDVIVLARYMQILTPDFVAANKNKIINIHHSFLPAFVGANPYERAYQRGVKLIGATSHFVTDELDEGPIIEQDISRVDHRDNSEAMKKIGQSIERSVLARAVKWQLEDRIIVHQNKTIVF